MHLRTLLAHKSIMLPSYSTFKDRLEIDVGYHNADSNKPGNNACFTCHTRFKATMPRNKVKGVQGLRFDVSRSENAGSTV